MLEWIVSIIELCNQSVAAGKVVRKLAEESVTAREKELLRAAHLDGLFQLGQNEMDGKFVLAGSRAFTGEDPAVAAHYLEAFMRICDRGLVIHEADEMFRLTGQGFDYARKLARSVS